MKDKNQTTNFAKQLSKVNSSTSDSFIDTDKDLNIKQIKILSEFLSEKILESNKIGSRKLYLLYTEPDTFQISVNSVDNSKVVIFDSYIIQSISGIYLVLASKFNIYDVLNREPYHETLGEYNFITELSKVLGLKHVEAYDIPKNHKLNEKVVVDENLSPMYCGDDEISFLIYRL